MCICIITGSADPDISNINDNAIHIIIVIMPMFAFYKSRLCSLSQTSFISSVAMNGTLNNRGISIKRALLITSSVLESVPSNEPQSI